MNFFEAGLPWDRRGSVLMESPEVARELELLLDGDFLVAEDCETDRPVSTLPHLGRQGCSQTTPRSATSRALTIVNHNKRQSDSMTLQDRRTDGDHDVRQERYAQLVLLRISELSQVDARQLSADCRCQMRHLRCGRQQRLLLWIGKLRAIGDGELCEGLPLDVGEVRLWPAA